MLSQFQMGYYNAPHDFDINTASAPSLVPVASAEWGEPAARRIGSGPRDGLINGAQERPPPPALNEEPISILLGSTGANEKANNICEQHNITNLLYSYN